MQKQVASAPWQSLNDLKCPKSASTFSGDIERDRATRQLRPSRTVRERRQNWSSKTDPTYAQGPPGIETSLQKELFGQSSAPSICHTELWAHLVSCFGVRSKVRHEPFPQCESTWWLTAWLICLPVAGSLSLSRTTKTTQARLSKCQLGSLCWRLPIQTTLILKACSMCIATCSATIVCAPIVLV